MRITLALGSAACAGLVSLAAPAAALPASGAGHIAKGSESALIQKVEFVRRKDGSVEYKRPRFDDKGPYYFYYKGFAYPYNPGYTYRLTRGELRPSDRLRRYRLVD